MRKALYFTQSLQPPGEYNWGSTPELSRNLEKIWGVKIGNFWAESKIPPPTSTNLMGIEIEIEGATHIKSWPPMHYWTAHPDGSLRNNGVEWVSSPTPAKNLAEITIGLMQMFPKHLADPSFSWRTSIHVHVNVQQMTEEQILNMVILYLIFENALFKYADEKRKHSVFCVPLLECQDTFTQIMSVWRKEVEMGKGVNWQYMKDIWQKYAALGIFRIDSYGTLEFRHLPGTWDVKKIVGWVCLLSALQQASIAMSASKIEEHIMKVNTLSYYTQLRKEVFKAWDYLLDYPEYQSDLTQGITRLKEAYFFVPGNKILKKGTAIKTLEKKLKERELRREQKQKKDLVRFLLNQHDRNAKKIDPSLKPRSRKISYDPLSQQLVFNVAPTTATSLADEAEFQWQELTPPPPPEEWNDPSPGGPDY